MSEEAGREDVDTRPASSVRSSSTGRSTMVEDAEAELRRHFAADDPRLTHSLAVAACAMSLGEAVDDSERDVLAAAALLHDVGKAEDVESTGFHPLDGARYLRRQGWPEDVCALVAHHSGARYVAWARDEAGLVEGVDGFEFAETPLTDALTAADQTVGPDGTMMQVEERMRDMLQRHGAGSPQALAHARRAPYVRAAVARVEARLEAQPAPDPARRPSRGLVARLTARVPRPRETSR